jgi:hypothetical protein
LLQPPNLAVAAVAVAVCLSAPFWEDAALAMVNLRTPAAHQLMQRSLAADQQEQRLADLERRLTSAVTQTSKLQADLALVQQKQEAGLARARAQAILQLAGALRRGSPFDAELALAHSLGSDLQPLQPALVRIEPYAASGVPTADDLRLEFVRRQDRVLRSLSGPLPIYWASSAADWARTWTGQAVAPAAPIVQQMRAAAVRLQEDNIPSALALVKTFETGRRADFERWIADVEARLTTDSLDEQLGLIGRQLAGRTRK